MRDDPFATYDLRRRNDEQTALWVDDGGWTESDVPRRRWVAPGFALRGGVTVIIGPPSAMKSSLMLAWSCAVALGREHGAFRPTEPGVVAVYNVEDDRVEQQRRLSAVLRQFDAIPADIVGKVIRAGPEGVGTLYTRDRSTATISTTAAMVRLKELIAERRPAMVIVDPLAELHDADENDNNALRAIIAELRALAVEFDIAAVVVHHTRKGIGAPGDPDTARGASAIIGAVRSALTLMGMSEDDAEALGLPKDRKSRSAYVRLDDAKQNYASVGDAQWYEKVVYALDNGEAVPAAVPWKAPNFWQSIPITVANAILDDIEAGIDGGKQRYSDAPAAKERSAFRVVQQHVPSFNEQQARSFIKTWRKNDVLRVDEYDDEVDRKSRKGLFVNDVRRPGAVR
jgi:hypothetical protein